MEAKIRVGIVGATVTQGGSGWGANAHVPALHALPEFELKAVCTAHEDTARESAAKFGAPLAFHDFDAMVASPEVDLIAVSVRVPGHHDLVMRSLRGGKATFCEWPLGADLAQAEEMAGLARERSLRTAVGLQARSDPALMFARELIQKGEIGEVLGASMSVVSQAVTERGAGRVWQRERKNGANTLTIAGGHAIDALCYILGEFSEVTARTATTIKQWHNTDTGAWEPVDSPDWISVAGQLTNGAQVSFLVATVPYNPSGNRFEIYGRDGTLAINARGSNNLGPNVVLGAKGKEPLSEIEVPDRFNLVPEGTPQGPPRNVAQAYVRLADAWRSGELYDPDFDDAVTRHKLIDAVERSAEQGKAVRL